MSLRTVVDVAVLFENFRNIDLFHQGLYHLKARVKHESTGDEWTAAAPYGYTAAPLLNAQVDQPKPKSSRIDHHSLIGAQLLEDQDAFVTRSFLIRYCEEEVEIHDMGHFRIEVDVRPEKPNGLVLMLQVELMFADLAQHGGADAFGENMDLTTLEFKRVSTQTFRVLGANSGLHEFYPVVFDEFHFCLANMVVQTALLDVRFRLLPSLLSSSGSAPASGAQAGKSPPESTSGHCAPSVSPARYEPLMAGKDGEDGVPLSLLECIFGCGVDKEAPDSGAWRTSPGGLLLAAESFCQLYLDLLSKSYQKLIAWFKELCDKCLTQGQRDSLADALEMPAVRNPFDTFLSLLGETPALPGMPLDPELSDLTVAKEGAALVNGHGRGQQLRVFFTHKLGGKVTAQALTSLIAYNMNAVSMQLFTLWHNIIDVSSIAGRELVALLKKSWEQQASEQWRKNVVRQVVHQELGSITDDTDIAVLHGGIKRASNRPMGIEVVVEDANGNVTVDSIPTVLEQRYALRSATSQRNGIGGVQPFDATLPTAPRQYRGLHLFVLVHGFQGNSFDMRLMKNNLAMVFPDAIFLMSNVNEDNTEGDMSEMGIRLAQEVVNYVSDWCPGSALGRLSFVAYSIGGIILRAALPLLKEFKDKMYTFLSFSTPHLGYMDQQSPLFNAVVWSLKKWRKIRCLDQLTMTDASDPKESFLYRLSANSGIKYFKWVVVVSSKQDNYAPYKSSRVEFCPSWEKQSNKEAYSSMVRNFWEGIKHDRVLRLNVHFDLPERNLDKAIGRAAHIKFIENQALMRMIIHNYSFLFR